MTSLRVKRILRFFLCCFLIIGWRLWYLSTLNHQAALELAKRPQRRVILTAAERGTIRDRFNIPLAVNRIQYNVTVTWQQVRNGQKKMRRKEYITHFSKEIGCILNMDPEEIEDRIYAKAALLDHIPFLLKEGLSEKEYFQLKMLEKEFPGLSVERVSRRFYPQGPVGCHILGYMGAISQSEYDKVVFEMRALKEFLHRSQQAEVLAFPAGFSSFEQVERRLKELERSAYRINDFVGKTGIEAQFEEILRGVCGRQVFSSDRLGKSLEEEEEPKAPQNGQRLLLTISSELQAFAESLLEENEFLREGRCIKVDRYTHQYIKVKQPWIKGGAIVALDPNTGEVLALASYPRFDPNDFIAMGSTEERQAKIERVKCWLENREWIAALWEQRVPMRRKMGKQIEERFVTWDFYLESILPEKHPVRHWLYKTTIQEAVEHLKGRESEEEALFKADCAALLIDENRFSEELLSYCGTKSLKEYHQEQCAYLRFCESARPAMRHHFHKSDFAAWKKQNQKKFLKEKRKEEQERKQPARPFLDYLDREEKRQFELFWQNIGQLLLALVIKGQQLANHPLSSYFQTIPLPPPELKNLSDWPLQSLFAYLKTFRSFKELDKPLRGNYAFFAQLNPTLADLAAGFYPASGFGYGRSWAFRQSTQVGSLFKLVPAYCALLQSYRKGNDFSPLMMVDDTHLNEKKSCWNIGYRLDRTPIPQVYKGGRLPRSDHPGIGKIDLAGALESSSNPYFALLAAEVIDSPQAFLDAADALGFGKKTGIALPGEIQGALPNDLEKNKTGLYATAIGQHTIVSTPLQAAVMLAAIANGGTVWQPQILKMALQKEQVFEFTPVVQQVIPMPVPVRSYLLNAMHQVIVGTRGTARANHIRTFTLSSKAMRTYQALQKELVGKTSTAEAMARIHLGKDGKEMVKHVGFGAIAFDGPFATSKPELVVVIYLRYGDYGKEAVPLAVQIVDKWREIKQCHQ